MRVMESLLNGSPPFRQDEPLGKGFHSFASGAFSPRPAGVLGRALAADLAAASALAVASALAFALLTLGGAGVISNAGALSLIRTLTSPPLTSLPNNSSSASGCLIFSCTRRAIGRAP